MKKLFACLFSMALLVGLSSATHAVVINEIFTDDADDDTNEFIELFGTPGQSLDGLSFIVIDNDSAGNTSSSAYRRVNYQYDFVAQSIPSDGYFVFGGGPDLVGVIDVSFPAGSLQNGSQTYALVNTTDIAYDNSDIDELTQASIEAIRANAIDIVVADDQTPGDDFDGFTPILSSSFGIQAASRIPNGVDTDSASDWRVFPIADRGVELGGPGDIFATPGGENIPEPSSLALVGLTLTALAVKLGRP